MNTAGFYQSTADAIGVPLYVYPDGSVTNFRKADAKPIATIERLGVPIGVVKDRRAITRPELARIESAMPERQEP